MEFACRSVWAGPDGGLTGDAREFVGRLSDLIDQATECLGERVQVGAIRAPLRPHLGQGGAAR